MCGIAGFAGMGLGDGEAGDRVKAMCDAIVHRGPDSDGYFLGAGVALGMRRLSIIDVAGGRQPISNEDGTVTVVFNGEIYNHHALRRELESAGHRFATRSDTEVLVHLYEEHGPDMVRRLQGMFAFSIWDSRNRRLFLARDRTGMKPLSYAVRNGGILFCSELRSLYAFDRAALRVDSDAIMEYLAFGYVPDPRSIFVGVRKLPPAHFLLWTPGGDIEVRRYWTPPAPDGSITDEAELIAEIRLKLDSAVRTHLESEVPLGAFLSGGLDSSTVVGLMCRHASGRVKTFSIGFDEQEFDESPAARAVAGHFGTDHHDLIVRPDVEPMFESVAAMFDEPFADSSAIATFLVAQLARRTVTVALSGDGGDELFGGYTRYGETLRYGDRPRGAATRRLASLGPMLPHALLGRNRLIDLGRSRIGRYAATVLQPVRTDEGGVASSAHRGGRIAIEARLRDRFPEDSGADFAAAMMRVDLETYLPGDILTKVDRTSMAVSLEARVPLLDYDLVDLSLRIPGILRVTPGQSKRLFRRAIEGLVPDFVLSRPKQGFAVPLAAWFRGPLRHRIEDLCRRSTQIEPYVDRGAVKRLVTEHLIGRRDHSAVLWRLIVLDFWLAALRDGRMGRPPSVPLGNMETVGAPAGSRSAPAVTPPPPVSALFLHSKSARAPLRVGILVDESGIPRYARGILEDLRGADYVAAVLVAVVRKSRRTAPRTRGGGIAYRTYVAYLESRYQTKPDPLEPVDCNDLLAGIPRLTLDAVDRENEREIRAEDLDVIVGAGLDVLIDLGRRPPRGAALAAARHGVWRYHFGDRRRYPAGSGFLQEIVDGSALSGIELMKIGATPDGDATLLRALFSTAPFPSRQANRFAPIWGARHFVIQSLWELHGGAAKLPAVESRRTPGGETVSRIPGNVRIGRWLLGELGRRMFPALRRGDYPVHWRIAVRRTRVPLSVDSSLQALNSFRWLSSDADRDWADPVLFQHCGQSWLFFEEMIDSSRIGHIACGRLEGDGRLVEVRPVLQRPHHLSYPQVFRADGEIFMLPESAHGGGVDLYRARRFPDDWVLEERLLNFRCVDSSVFQAADAWWMMTSPQVVPGHAPITWLLRAERPVGPWEFHPGGVVASDASVARGGGAVFEAAGRFIRPSQDCSGAYGRALLLNEMTSRFDEPYSERTICRIDAGWTPNLASVHSYGRVGEWEAIDGGFRIDSAIG